MNILKALVAAAALLLPTIAAAEQKYGDWSTGVTTDGDTVYAAVSNDSGAIFAEACTISINQCRWVLTIDTKCDSGANYPALGNTDTGASSFDLVCDKKINEKDYRYFFSSWKELETFIRKGQMLGIAFPLSSGRFVVYRFSLNGMSAATTAMESVFSKVVKEKEKNSTETITL